MQLSKGATALVLVVLIGLWLISNVSVFSTTDFAALRNPAIVLTGVLAVGFVCLGAILALRSRLPERSFGGLDKLYRAHRAFGIAGLTFAVAHWVLIEEPGWFGGGMEHHGGGGRHGGGAPTSGFAHWLQTQHGLAGTLANWGFYALVVLAAVALISRIPYRLFYLSHRLMAVIVLLLAYHALVYFPYAQWPSAIGAVLAILLLGGVAAAVVSLAGRIGVHRQGQGRVTDFTYYPELQVLQAEVEVTDGWPGHKPGQFAFVHGGRWEGQHPFTIASAWHPDERKVVFVTKELGDFTATLKDRARIGAPVEIEGPYGNFTFEDDCPMQIWIAGGVGITPFVAMMRERQRESDADHHDVHLFYTSQNQHEEGLGKLSALAQDARVDCHFLHTPRDGYLTGEKVRATVPEWTNASIWFCGPAAFGEAIRSDFAAHGLKPRSFHQELFAWR